MGRCWGRSSRGYRFSSFRPWPWPTVTFAHQRLPNCWRRQLVASAFCFCACLAPSATTCLCDWPGRDCQFVPGDRSRGGLHGHEKRAVECIGSNAPCRDVGCQGVRGLSRRMVRRGRLGTKWTRSDRGKLSQSQRPPVCRQIAPAGGQTQRIRRQREAARGIEQASCCLLLPLPHFLDRFG